MSLIHPYWLVAVAVAPILVATAAAYTAVPAGLLALAAAGTLGVLLAVPVIRSGQRALERALQHDRLANAGRPTVGIEQPDRHREARVLYYAGMVTLSWLVVRIYGFTLSDYLFLAAAAIAFAQALGGSGYRFYKFPNRFMLGVLLLGLGALIATGANAAAPLGSLGILARVLYLLIVWLLLGTMVLRTPGQVRTAVGCWVFGAAVSGAWAIAQQLDYFPAPHAAAGRMTGLTEHVNDLGSLSAIALAPALALIYVARWKLAAATGVVGITAGLVLSGSVGAGLAAVCALAVCLASRQLARVVLVGAALSLAVVALAAATTDLGGTQFARLSVTLDPDAPYAQGTFYNRLETAEQAWEALKQDPLVGAGLDEESSSIYSPRAGEEHQVHNLFLGRWFESGLLGLLGIFLIVVSMFTTGWRAVVEVGSRREQLLALGVFGGAVAFVIVAMSAPVLYQRYALVPMSMIFALSAVHWRSRSMAQSPQGMPPDSAQDGRESEVSESDVPRCSVVVATRGRIGELQRCLEALRHLDHPSHEIIVVDNSAGSGEVERLALGAGARYVLEARAGLSCARNTGARAARGGIIAVIDDDAVAAPDWLSAHEAALEDQTLAATTGRVLPLEDGAPVARAISAAAAEYDLANGVVDPSHDAGAVPIRVDRTDPRWFELSNFGGLGSGTNLAFRRSLIEMVGGFREDLGLDNPILGEEHYFTFSLIRTGHAVSYLPHAVVHHPMPTTEEERRARTYRELRSSAAYMTMLLVEERGFRWASLRYLAGAVRGGRRSWRPPLSLSPTYEGGIPRLRLFVSGAILYLRVRRGRARSDSYVP